jgi:hypothetical protein
MKAGRRVRLGHALCREDGETLDDVVLRSIALLYGRQRLEPRPPRKPGQVYGAEEFLGHTTEPRPIYAYLGDIHPDLGLVGLVIDRRWPLDAISRCDSGGLFGGAGDFEAVPEPDRSATLQALSTPKGLSKEQWEDFFDDEIDRLYPSVEDYVRGAFPNLTKVPKTDQRYGYLHRAHERSSRPGEKPADRRLWTWEARAFNAPNATTYLTLVLSNTASNKLQQLVAKGLAEMPPDTCRVLPAEDDPAGEPGAWGRPDDMYLHLLAEAES